MLMPALSVTAIGVAIAIVGIIRGRPAARVLLGGFSGAWLGFLAGAILGVVLDVLLGNGVYLALIGHMGAAAGALLAVARTRTRTRTRTPAGSR